ncbi:hypothetical protein AN958_12737 [Leucoagaricus sp. SymC.cos]|nr:hypothetical protein AN958_12737 [Leucoagaricus sp. SymC.cos]
MTKVDSEDSEGLEVKNGDGNQIRWNTPYFTHSSRPPLIMYLTTWMTVIFLSNLHSLATPLRLPPLIQVLHQSKIKIVDLFDFHNPEWLSMLIKPSKRVLRQEYEICEVLNGGTSGDDSGIIDTDTTMEDIMFRA